MKRRFFESAGEPGPLSLGLRFSGGISVCWFFLHVIHVTHPSRMQRYLGPAIPVSVLYICSVEDDEAGFEFLKIDEEGHEVGFFLCRGCI